MHRELLLAATQEEDVAMRPYAYLALGDFEPGAKAALPELRKALADSSQSVQVATADALWKLDDRFVNLPPVSGQTARDFT